MDVKNGISITLQNVEFFCLFWDLIDYEYIAPNFDEVPLGKTRAKPI